MTDASAKVNAKIAHWIFSLTPSWCRACRSLLGLTQKELAAAALVAPQTIADFERGARTPHVNNLKAIASALEQRGITFVVEQDAIVGVRWMPPLPQ
ncbi:MAG: helix-turn-helix domain-containing protein [Bauldia sp.]